MMMVAVPVVPLLDYQPSMSPVWSANPSGEWPGTPSFNTYPAVSHQECFQQQHHQQYQKHQEYDNSYDGLEQWQNPWCGGIAEAGNIFFPQQLFSQGMRTKTPTVHAGNNRQKPTSPKFNRIQNRNGQERSPKSISSKSSSPKSSSPTTSRETSPPAKVDVDDTVSSTASTAETVMEEELVAPIVVEIDTSKLEEGIEKGMALLHGKDEIKIQAHYEKSFAPDAVMSWPDMAKEIRGRTEVISYIIDTVRNVPDLQLVLQNCDRDEGAVRYYYTVSGKAIRDNPLFPAGKSMCWQFRVVCKMDSLGRVTHRQATIDMPAVLSLAPSILNCLLANAQALSRTPTGTRILQAAVDKADLNAQVELAEQFRHHVWEASASPHANHVLQKCIVCMPRERVQFIVDEMRGRVVAAAQHRTRCRILERLMEHCSADQTTSLVDEVLVSASTLFKHAFGNFIVQRILEHGSPEQTGILANIILADVIQLSKHKIASNVVRAALIHSPSEQKEQLLHALSADPRELASLAHHRIGSFVVREVKFARAH